MRNPRPCKWCGLPEALHWMLNACGCYEGVERTEPLRADRGQSVPVRVLREYLDDTAKTLGRKRAELRPGVPERWTWYYDGRIDSLAAVARRFCD